MNRAKLFYPFVAAVLLSALLLAPLAARAQVLSPARGGTGASTTPSSGQVLIGQPNGTYAPQATSTLGFITDFSGKTTSDLAEGTNLYYTLARLQTALASGYSAIFGSATTTSATTTNLAVSGSLNLFGTVITDLASWFNGLFDTRLGTKSTTDLAEGSNLYFTSDRADARVAAGTSTIRGMFSAGSGLSYSSGAFSLDPSGDWTGTFDGQQGSYYLDRANHSGSQLSSTISDFAATVAGILAGTTTDAIDEGSTNRYFTDARARGAISLTTTGSSGAATYDSGTGVLNIPEYGGGGAIGTTTALVDGQLIVATGADTVAGITNVATGRVLISQGASAVPIWSETATLGTALNSPIIRSNANTSLANFSVGSATGVNNQISAASHQLNGSSNMQSRVFFNGSGTTVLTANASAAFGLVGAQVATEATSGTHDLIANWGIGAASIANGSAATTNFASLYIDGAATGTFSPTNNYALWVNDNGGGGTVRFDGNVGIGTVSPSKGLEVQSSTGFNLYDTTYDLGITSNRAANNQISIRDNTTDIFQYNGSSGALTLRTLANADITFDPNGTGNSLFESGNVGIGTTSPPRTFSVQTASSPNVASFLGSNASYINVHRTSQASNSGLQLGVSSTGAYEVFGKTTHKLGLGTNDTEYVTILNGGNTGIGTTTPFAKLGVAGDAYIGGNLTATGTVAVTATATSTFSGPVRSTCFSTDGTTCLSASGGSDQSLTVTPAPNYPTTGGLTAVNWNSNTTGHFTQFKLGHEIEVNKISFYVDGTPVAGTVDIGIYSEDGQTQLVSLTTASLSGSGAKTETLGSPVTLPAGVYYLAVVPNSTASINIYGWQPTNVAAAALNSISGEPVLYGTMTVSAGTLPATFTPSSITASSNGIMPFTRFDN